MTDKYEYFKGNIDLLIGDMRDGFQRMTEAQKAVHVVIDGIKTSTDLTEIEKIGLAAYAVNEVGRFVKNDIHKG